MANGLLLRYGVHPAARHIGLGCRARLALVPPVTQALAMGRPSYLDDVLHRLVCVLCDASGVPCRCTASRTQ